MEFCPRTLSRVLEEGPMDEADAWMVLRGLLQGLAHIHAQVWGSGDERGRACVGLVSLRVEGDLRLCKEREGRVPLTGWLLVWFLEQSSAATTAQRAKSSAPD